MSRTAEIKLTVDLDDDNVPSRIAWEASEARESGPTPCQSMMLSLWDSDRKSIAAIDLWTKDTTIDDMNLYFYQAIHRMAETYLRATKNQEAAELIHDLGERFGATAGLVGNGIDRGAQQNEGRLDLVSMAEGKRERRAK